LYSLGFCNQENAGYIQDS